MQRDGAMSQLAPAVKYGPLVAVTSVGKVAVLMGGCIRRARGVPDVGRRGVLKALRSRVWMRMRSIRPSAICPSSSARV
jgi:hypothetical protein